jgi:hypothetical protein
METQITKIDPKEFGLELTQVETIEQAFLPKIQERDGLIEIYRQVINSELTPFICNQAGDLRKKLVKVRTGLADIHKTQKAFFLSAGRYVDAWKNKETLPIEQMEENLSSIENHFINLEKQRIAQVEKDRTELLKQYMDFVPAQLGLMNEDVFNAYLASQKVAYEARIAAELKAEADRLAAIEAERIENERIRIENARLQAEADAKQKLIESERKAAEAARVKAQAEADAKQKLIESERKAAEAARVKAQAEADAKLKAERDARIKAENEMIVKQAAEVKAHQAAELAAKKAAATPVKSQVNVWIDSLIMPQFTNDATIQDIRIKFEGFKNWAKNQINGN